LKVEINDINTARKKIEIVVPSEEVNQRIKQAFKEVSKTAKLDGFRKGKIPRNILEKHFGAYVREHASHEMVKEFINKALDDAKIHPVVPPVVQPGQVKKDQEFAFTAEIEILPPIEKVDYEGISVEVPFAEVTEEAVDFGLENMRMRFATLKKPDPARPAQKGDYVRVDYDARGDKGPAGGEKNVAVEIGRNIMPPEFEDGLVGMSEGETKTITVKFPKQEEKDSGEKEVITFEIAMKEIKEKILPNLDDEFAKDVGMQNLAEVRDHLKQKIIERAETEKKENARRQIMKKVREKNPIDLPPTLVEEQRKLIIEEAKQRFAQMKIPFREDQFSEEFLGTAREQVHDDILLQVVADSQSIKAGDEDVDKYIEDWAREMGQSTDKLKAALKSENRMESVKYRLRREKTLDFLQSAVTINYVNKKDSEADKNAQGTASEETKPKRGES